MFSNFILYSLIIDCTYTIVYTMADEIAQAIGLDPQLLNREFPDTHGAYLAFSKHIVAWDEIAPFLGLSKQNIRGIGTDLNLGGLGECCELWHGHYTIPPRSIFSPWSLYL